MTSTELAEALEGIFSSLRRLRRLVANRRRLGIDPILMRDQLQTRGLVPSNDLLDLYGLCDGTDSFPGERLSATTFFPGYHWLKFDDALAIYDLIPDDPSWNRSWFPIFDNGGGDFYAVICNCESNDFGSVIGFLRGEPDCFVEFQNVTIMLQTIDRAFREQVFFLKGERLVADYPSMRSIAQKLQPSFEVHDAQR